MTTGEGSTGDVRAAIEAFHRLYQQDVLAGTLRERTAYLARFPGFTEHIARELAVLEDPGTEPLRAERRSLPPASSDLPFRVLGHYRLLERLGAGGQGEVFRAHDEQLERTVALKLLHDRSKSGELRFVREAKSASRLHHPAICTVYEAGEIDGHPYIAMRYVEGRTLQRLVEEARAAVRPCVDLTGGRAAPGTRQALDALLACFARCADALAVAHAAGLLHRDIKPGNIMVDAAGEPVLLDFGLARDVDGVDAAQSRVMGTPHYMSPEQLDPARALSGTGHLDARTDVYSLGVTIYECLTLRRPFDGIDWGTLYDAIMHGEPPDPATTQRWVPRDLAVVLQKALEKHPDDRYASAADLAAELRRVREGQPIRARPAGPATRARKWVRRNPLVALLLAASLVLAGTATWLLAAERAARRESARLEAAERTARQQSARLEARRAFEAAWALHRTGHHAEARAAYSRLRFAEVRAAEELEVLSIDTLVGDLRFSEARERLRALGHLTPPDLGPPAGGLLALLRAELLVEALDDDAVERWSRTFVPADLAYARASVAGSLADMLAHCETALAEETMHRRALRARAFGLAFSGERALARADVRLLRMGHLDDPTAMLVAVFLDALDPESAHATAVRELPPTAAAFDALARAGTLVVDLGMSQLVPDRGLGPMESLALTGHLGKAIAAAAAIERASVGGDFQMPRAVMGTVRGVLGLIWRPSPEKADAVLASIGEPFAYLVRGTARCDAGDVGGLADLELARTRPTVVGSGRGLRLVLFRLLARRAAQPETDAERALGERLRELAERTGMDLVSEPKDDREWLLRLAETARRFDFAAVALAAETFASRASR